ncbi:MAG: hypothetical protein QXZ11_07940 [Thermoproteota archaeon]
MNVSELWWLSKKVYREIVFQSFFSLRVGGTLPQAGDAEKSIVQLVRSAEWNFMLNKVIFAIFIGVFGGFTFIYVSAFWNIAPMPSNVYPGTNIYWPIQARWLRLFASGGAAGLLNPLLVAGFFVIGLIVFAVSEVTRLSIPVIALSAGAAQPLPYSVSLLIGMIIGKLVEKRIGRDFWSRYRNSIVAGISLGVGLIITISVAIGLILKNMWILPY